MEDIYSVHGDVRNAYRILEETTVGETSCAKGTLVGGYIKINLTDVECERVNRIQVAEDWTEFHGSYETGRS